MKNTMSYDDLVIYRVGWHQQRTSAATVYASSDRYSRSVGTTEICVSQVKKKDNIGLRLFRLGIASTVFTD